MSIERIVETVGLSESEIEEKINDTESLSDSIRPTDKIPVSPRLPDD